MSTPGAEHASLKGKADYFFASRACGRREVQDFASRLEDLGPTVVIGGLLRDLHLGGLRRFRSDVDFVVQAASASGFETFVAAEGGRRNRFGGYGIGLGRWKVDVWPLERTWAATAGHVEVKESRDLLRATFFDFDAVLYSVAARRLLHGPGYFERVAARTLDINLEPNPNPLGNAVRALRYACRWRASLGPRLAAHVLRQIRDHSWSGLVADEMRGFTHPLLPSLDGGRTAALLEGFEKGPVTLVEADLGELPLEGGCLHRRDTKVAAACRSPGP